MPCTQTGSLEGDRILSLTGDNDKLKKEYAKLEAILCGVFSKLSTSGLKFILDNLDYSEMGVSREEIEQWWEDHQKRDKKRKADVGKHKREMQVRVETIKSDYRNKKG